MNHGIGMMLGCVIPVAAILILPGLGVSPLVALVAGFGGMIGLHAGMMGFHRLRQMTAVNHDLSAHFHHHA